MQLLDVPTTQEDIKYSLSLTGITFLKETKYKTRHSLHKDLVQIPSGGIIYKKEDYAEIERKRLQKKVRRSVTQDQLITSKKERQAREYVVNKKEVTHRIRNMVLAMPGEKQLYFWTVTFPLNTTDDTAFILLNKWLTRLRKERMLKSYLWVSERQENGTIHFHIAINHRMDVKRANKYMRASIMYCLNEGSINLTRDQATKYNGVDISKNRKTRRVTNFARGKNARHLTSYLTKYVTKNNESFQHLAWHSSRDYSNLVIAVRFTCREIERSKVFFFADSTKILEGQYFKFFRWSKAPPNDLMKYLSQLNRSLLSNLQN